MVKKKIMASIVFSGHFLIFKINLLKKLVEIPSSTSILEQGAFGINSLINCSLNESFE